MPPGRTILIIFAAMKICFRVFFGLLLILCTQSCKKDHRVLDASVQPEDDLLTAQYNESAVLYGYAQNTVPVYTFNDRYKFLGSHYDKIFGKVDVGLYLNINTTLSNISFSLNPVLDSAAFVFAVDSKNFDGSLFSSLTFSVFTLDSALSAKNNYNTSNFSLYNPVPLPTMPVTSVKESSEGFTVRIKLDQAFAKDFISYPQYLTDNATMQSKYKGFYLAANAPSGDGVILRCDLEDPFSGLFFYVRATDTSATGRSEKFNFSGSSAVRFNTVKQDLSTAHASLKAQSPADSVSSPYFFVKGLGITNSRIMIPGLNSYADSTEFAINRAEVTFEVDNDVIPGGFFVAPPALCLLPLTPAGRDTFAIDQLATIDNARYGGVYSGGKYTFNITRHVQAMAKHRVQNNGFVLVVANPERLDLMNNNGILTRVIRRDFYSEGIVLYGPAAQEKAPRLKLSFVRLITK